VGVSKGPLKYIDTSPPRKSGLVAKKSLEKEVENIRVLWSFVPYNVLFGGGTRKESNLIYSYIFIIVLIFCIKKH